MLIVLLVVACGNILWLAQWKLSSSSSAATAPLAPAAPQPPAAGRGADPANRGRSAPQQQQQQPLQNLQQPPAPPETQPAAEPLKVEVWGQFRRFLGLQLPDAFRACRQLESSLKSLELLIYILWI